MSTETEAGGGRFGTLLAPTTRTFLLVGFVAWAVATVGLRLGGHYVFDPGAPLVVAAVYAGTVPGMMALAVVLFRWQNVRGAARTQAAAALVLPGMLLDVFAIAWFGTVFPNMAGGASNYFAGQILLAYGSILVAGLLGQR
jgi:hypothetical protein